MPSQANYTAVDAFQADQAASCSNPRAEDRPIGELIATRLSRRQALLGGAAAAVGLSARPAEAAGPSTLTFPELPLGLDDTHHVPEGYRAQVLIRWGDKVVADAPAFTPGNLTATAQERQFGYNCDYVGFHPLPRGSTASDRGLLAVNHEYVNTSLMFKGIGSGRSAARNASLEQAQVEQAAHGVSIVEIRRSGGAWSVVADSIHARRLTANTPMILSGPAAGHEKLRTTADPTGTKVLGTLNNCAGGNTPWGTALTCEENFNVYFGGDVDGLPDAGLYKRYGLRREGSYSWPAHFDRFNLDKEPNEPNRFGWVVEFDPYDPASTPVKRTALGRLKHEGATHVVAPDGRAVIYMGDDERGEHVYKFVTKGKVDPANPAANRDLLDEGTLYVARFEDDGSLKWLPLVQGEGPLTAENGFATQADVLINTRGAADLLKATPMDRPEDVETDPVTGSVFVILTNNNRRKADQVDKANPRPNNVHGHVIEIVPPKGDHASVEAKWKIFLLAGKPGIDAGALYHRATSGEGWLSCPDNCAFDVKGRIWIATDGAQESAGIADGLWAADVSGHGRALTRHFFQAPIGSEVCGPCFTPDGETLFLAVQHPGEGSGSTFEEPATRWPDFQADTPPRPSVLAITRKGGGIIGA